MAKGNEVGKRIHAAREAKSLSASELARRVGVTPTAVWNWETNEVVPRHEVLGKVAIALGVSEDFLLTGRNDLDAAAEESPGTTVLAFQLIEEAKARIAVVTGFPIDRVKLRLELVAE